MIFIYKPQTTRKLWSLFFFIPLLKIYENTDSARDLARKKSEFTVLFPHLLGAKFRQNQISVQETSGNFHPYMS